LVGRRPMGHSPEDAVETTDSIAAAPRVFIAFGGPPRAMGHSLTVAALFQGFTRGFSFAQGGERFFTLA
jgi:hypothetical protein